MILFDQLLLCKDFEEFYQKLSHMSYVLGGRERPSTEELSPVLGMVVGQMLPRPTFENDFTVLLNKMDPILQSSSRMVRGQLAESVFNLVGLSDPSKYLFVVNAWTQAAGPTFVPEIENSLRNLAHRGLELSVVHQLVNDVHTIKPNVWSDLRESALSLMKNNRDAVALLTVLARANQLQREDLPAVFNDLCYSVSPGGNQVVKNLIALFNVSLEEFLDEYCNWAQTHSSHAEEFIDVLKRFQEDPTADLPRHTFGAKSVFEKLIALFGNELSDKYTPALRGFEKLYGKTDKKPKAVQAWFDQMPYYEALTDELKEKSQQLKKKI